MWIWRIAKRLFGPAVVRIIEYLFKEHLLRTALGAALVAAMSAIWAWIEGVGWGFWVGVAMVVCTLALGVFDAFQTGRWKWPFPRASGKRPHVIPVESGWDDRQYSGLFFKNDGDAPAYNVVVEPLQLGKESVEFTGPEITYLEPGESAFLRPGNWPPSVMLLNKPRGNRVFELIRLWQLDIGDLKAEVKGRIRYSDRSGLKYDTRYLLRRDVLNTKSGLAIEVEFD